MKRLFVTIISISMLLSILLMSVSAFDTPYKGLTKGEMWKLQEFQPYVGLLQTFEKIDASEYASESGFELYGVYFKSIVPVVEHDENHQFGEKYLYNIVLDETKYEMAGEAYEMLELHENVKYASGFVLSTYGFGDINGNGEHDQYDYILSKRIYFETYEATDLELGYADMDFDGEITPRDYILAKRTYFGTFFPYSADD